MKKLILYIASLAGLFLTGLRQPFSTANAEGTVGTHEKAIGRFTDAAIATRHLLFKVGSDADHIVVAGASDFALGTVADEADAAEKRVHINLLGKGPTKKMVASAAIGAGVKVYAAAAGKIAATGTVLVGVSITAAAANNEVIEVNDHSPV